MHRKLVSWVMVLALVMGLCPAFAYAEEADLVAGEVPTDASDVGTVSLDGATVTLASEKLTYTGAALEPKVESVVVGGFEVPTEGYSVDYSDNVSAGTATVTVTGAGAYVGVATAEFTIAPAMASTFTVSSISDKTYNGEAKKPTPTVRFNGTKLVAGRDYQLSYSSNKAAGKAKVTITGKGNFTGKKTVGFKILRASVAKAKVAKIAKKTYSGSAFRPTPKVTIGGKALKRGRDYTLNYSGNKNAGTARVTVRGIGNYKGTKATSFAIARASLSGASMASVGAKQYTGGAIEPAPSVKWKGKTLKRGRDYTLSYANNVGAGTATVYATGIGNFSGTVSRSFEIQAPPPVVVSETVYITNTGAKYHRDGCSSLRRSRIPISRADAIARGYEACKNCRP